MKKPGFPPELPPVTNWALYIYRVLMKWLSFFVFGLMTVLLGILIIPPMRLVIHPRDRFSKYIRRFISASMRFFFNFMHFIGVVDLEIDNREYFRGLTSKIVVANHPSLLDSVMLVSLLPNADTIAASYLQRSILRGVVRQLYILNSNDINEILKSCDESLKKGNNIIIFPEGTRTPRRGKVILKKGAARVSLASGCGIIPVHIGGTDKYGLGKKDPWTGYNPRERYVYRVRTGEEIRPEKYQSLPNSAAARALTNDISAFIFPDGINRLVSVEGNDEKLLS